MVYVPIMYDVSQEQLDKFSAKFNIASLAPLVEAGFIYLLVADRYLPIDHKVYLNRAPEGTAENIEIRELRSTPETGNPETRDVALFKDKDLAKDFNCTNLSTKNDVGILRLDIIDINPTKLRLVHDEILPPSCRINF